MISGFGKPCTTRERRVQIAGGAGSADGCAQASRGLTRKAIRRWVLAVGIAGLLVGLLAHGVRGDAYAQEAGTDWRSDWAVKSGLQLEVDASGFDLPTALAFVPRPGRGPKDVLYFVTELRGAVKVVTNDRTVSTFARDFFSLIPREEVPHAAGEVGLAGICLEPRHGYVFVTFAYQDSLDVLRNGIVRFETDSPSFATEPVRARRIAPVLGADASAVSHQIGPCQVDDGTLYVGVGDGQRPDLSQDLTSTLGKILRMDLDGHPVAGNPHAAGGNPPLDARSYVWARGLRNPFSLRLVKGRLFAADNGLDVDRFLEIRRGENYLWDGSELSTGSRADVFISPSVGPVQMDYLDAGEDMLGGSAPFGRFLIATAGDPNETGPATIAGAKGVLAVEYDLDRGRAAAPPEVLLQYRGQGYQSVVGLAVGPDGLFLAPLFPNAAGERHILRLGRATSDAWPWTTETSRPPVLIMRQLGCFGCHAVSADDAPRPAPLLQRDSLRARLADRLFSEAYLRRLSGLDSLTVEPYTSFRAWRAAIRDASGEQRIRRWVYYQIQDPRFDDRNTGMPALGASESEAALLTDYLLGAGPDPRGPGSGDPRSDDLGLIHGVLSALRGWGLLPQRLRYRHLPIAFALGLLAGVLGYRVARAWLPTR